MVSTAPKASRSSEAFLLPMILEKRRVRKSVHDGVATYTYTEKLPTGISGKRIERERLIKESGYAAQLGNRDLSLHPIHKTRYRFPFGGKIFELDICEGNLLGRVYLKVELLHENEKVAPPPQFDLLDVTDEMNEKMSTLAKL